jgi:catalase
MQVANNVMSRQGHYFHEGKPSEYDQARELYTRVLTHEERKHLHQNTARLLKVRK